LIKQDKEGHSILIKGEIDQKEIIINLYAPNVNAPNCIKHTLKDLKAYIDSNAMVVGNFNTPLSSTDRSYKQKNQRNSRTKSHQDQMDLADVYRIFHPTSAQYTFFSATHGTFSKIDHILGHNANLSKYKKIEIIPCILSDHNALKLELNNKNNSRKYTNNWKHNKTLLNDQWVIDELKEEIKISWKLMEIKTQPTRTHRTQQRQS
jgi:exonuclease III